MSTHYTWGAPEEEELGKKASGGQGPQPVGSRLSGVPGKFWGSLPFADLGLHLGVMQQDLSE